MASDAFAELSLELTDPLECWGDPATLYSTSVVAAPNFHFGICPPNLTGDVQGSQLGRAAKTASKQLLKKELETGKWMEGAEHPYRIDSQGQRIYI